MHVCVSNVEVSFILTEKTENPWNSLIDLETEDTSIRNKRHLEGLRSKDVGFFPQIIRN